jgi:hypothetical protein
MRSLWETMLRRWLGRQAAAAPAADAPLCGLLAPDTAGIALAFAVERLSAVNRAARPPVVAAPSADEGEVDQSSQDRIAE